MVHTSNFYHSYILPFAPRCTHLHCFWCHPAIKSTKNFIVGYCSCIDDQCLTLGSEHPKSISFNGARAGEPPRRQEDSSVSEDIRLSNLKSGVTRALLARFRASAENQVKKSYSPTPTTVKFPNIRLYVVVDSNVLGKKISPCQ